MTLEPPIPRDIPLPLPADPVFLQVLLIVAFIAHIAFVNLMVGGSILVFGLQIRGLKDPDYDKLARELATTVTVNKSLAVVLGVAPLLLVNVLYTIHFYTANALTGIAWISLVPSITLAFGGLYLHKYTWDRLAARRRQHIALMLLPIGIFLVVPLVFLGNVTLMMFPERWTEVHGFWGAVLLPGVLPRYLHFMAASLILTSLFCVGYFGRKAYPVETTFEKLSRSDVRKLFYGIALLVSLAQFVFGPIVLVSLPSIGFSGSVLFSIGSGATLAVPAVYWMWQEYSAPESTGERLPRIAIFLTLTVLFMASGRHMYRGVALADHKRAMNEATAKWTEDAAQAAYEKELGVERATKGESPGQVVFQTNCSGCHGVDKKVVGPPLTEIATIYSNDPGGIVTWARAPGKKRPEAPQMPPFASIGDAKLKAVAEYMLEAGGKAKK